MTVGPVHAAAGLATAAALCLALGCATMTNPAPARVNYGGRPCWRLANDTVELIVSPELGRIVRYAFLGGTNLFWENPRAVEFAPRVANWNNWGGDKVWPWPQDCWRQVTGRAWPPPSDGADAPPHAVTPLPGGLRITSAAIPGLGFRIVRDVTLPPSGSRVTILNRLEATGPVATNAWAAWTITQTAVPDAMFARLDNGAAPSTWPFEGSAPLPPPTPYGRVLAYLRDPGVSGKSGFDADLLAARFGDVLLSQKVLPGATSPGTTRPGERAQFYIDLPVNPARPPELAPYLEIELTSPRRPVDAVGPVLAIEWQLHRLTAAQRESAALAALIESL